MSRRGGKGRREKGFAFEREVVNLALKAGVSAKRAYGSDGRNLGHAKEVDVQLGPYRASCKFHKELLNKYLRAPEGVDLMVVKENFGIPLVLIPLSEFLRWLGPKGEHPDGSGE